MSRISKTVALGSTAIITSLLAATAAHAQIDEITVTAQKREQTLQDTPVAVTAVTDAQIEQAQIRDAADLQQLAPSLRVAEFASSTNTEFNIRGIGTSSFNPGLEPSVGVFVDGVYLPRQGAAINDFLSLQRVEVIRGPQATLYGRNTPAGVVSFITKLPEYEFGYDAELTVGRFDQRVVKGSVTGPLAENLAAFRFDGVYHSADGMIENVLDDREFNNRNRFNLRGQLLIEPTEDIGIRLIAQHGKIDEDCCAAPFSFYDDVDLFAFQTLGATFAGDPLNPDPFSNTVAIDGRVNTELETTNFSGQVDWDFDGFTVTSISALQFYEEAQDIDADFSSLDAAGRRLIQDDYSAFTQELRVTSTGDNVVDWMVGAFYYNNKLDHTNNTPYGADLRPFVDLATRLQFSQSFGQAAIDDLFNGFGLGPTAGAPSLLELLVASNAAAGNPAALALAATGQGGPLLGGPAYLGEGQGLREEDYDYDTESWSIFGQVDWHVTDKLTLTGGLRYANETKDIDARIDILDPWSALDFGELAQSMRLVSPDTCLDPTNYQTCVFFVPALLAGAGVPIDPFTPLTDAQAADPATNVLLALSGLQFNPPSPSFSGSREDNNWAGNVIVSYDWTDRLNTYASYSTAFKPGGFNVSANAALTGVIEFEDEQAEAWEVGLKARVFGDRAFLNFAWFDQTIDDFQSNNFIGGGFALQNAGSLHTAGIEFDGQFQPDERFLMTGGFTWLYEREYEEFNQGPCPDISAPSCFFAPNPVTGLLSEFNNLTGQNISGTSEFTGNITATYFQPISETLEGFVRAGVIHVGEYSLVTSNDPRLVEDGFTLVNASVGIGAEDGGWQIQLWGRNLFDEEYFKGGFPSVGLPGVSTNNYPSDRPTYGVTLRLRH